MLYQPTAELRTIIETKIVKSIEFAEDKLQYELPKIKIIDISISLLYSYGAHIEVFSNNQFEFGVNWLLAETDQENFLSIIIPHELAHLIVFHKLLPYENIIKYFQKVSDHGIDWQNTMTNIFNLQPIVKYEYSQEYNSRLYEECTTKNKDINM